MAFTRAEPAVALIVALLLCFAVTAGAAQRSVVISFVSDGPDAERLHELYVREIGSLLGGEFDVRFPDDKVLHGGWELARIRGALDRALADPGVDIVVALGALSSNDAATRPRLPKPVVAPVVIDACLRTSRQSIS